MSAAERGAGAGEGGPASDTEGLRGLGCDDRGDPAHGEGVIMKPPNVVSEIDDTETGVVYRVVAYRELSRAEVVREVQRALRLREQRPKRGDFLTIRTSIA